MTTRATTEPAAAVDSAASALVVPLGNRGSSSGRRTAWQHARTPLGLLVVSLVLYWWVGQQSLDSIEQRVLNADVIRADVVQHLKLVAVSTLIVVATAIPLGVLLTRAFARWLVPLVVGAANVGQAVPSLGVLIVLALLWGIGFPFAVIALVLYAFLPVLRNTMVGLQQVDASIKDAARGQGMTKGSVLLKIELPLAVPVILAGVRTALVINVGTASIAVLTNAGGLGEIIYAGIVQSRTTLLVAGSVMTAVLALTVDYLAGVAERQLSPRGL